MEFKDELGDETTVLRIDNDGLGEMLFVEMQLIKKGKVTDACGMLLNEAQVEQLRDFLNRSVGKLAIEMVKVG